MTCLVSDVTGWLNAVSISHDGLEIHLDNDLLHIRHWPTTDCNYECSQVFGQRFSHPL